ncbi:MAG: hypothetical protein ACPGRE_05540 [Flavobacteriaceae bacterium]
MKKIVLLAAFLILGQTAVQAQSKVHEHKLKGTWVLHIDIEKELEKEKEDMNLMEQMIVGAVEGVVKEALESFEIQFEFKKHGVYEVIVFADDKEEREQGEYTINKNGQLVLEPIKNDNVSIDNDGVWMFSKGRLVAINDDGELEENVWMERK